MFKVTAGNYDIAFTFRHTRDANFEVKPGKVITDITSCLMTVNNEEFSGLAACLQEDAFDKAKGRKIALAKTLKAAQIPREARSEVWQAYWSRGAR